MTDMRLPRLLGVATPGRADVVESGAQWGNARRPRSP